MKPNLFSFLNNNNTADSDLDLSELQTLIEETLVERHGIRRDQAKAAILMSIENAAKESQDCECQGLFTVSRKEVFVHKTPEVVN